MLRYRNRATMRRHWTEQWRHDEVGRRPLANRIEFINFFKRNLISDDSSFCSHILSAINLQCHVFSFWKAFVKCPSLSINGIFWWRHIWRHLHVTMLKCGAKFSNISVQGSISMICAKNYETASKFVKVMPKILWPLFSGHGVYMYVPKNMKNDWE